jgi:hypothetical protein
MLMLLSRCTARGQNRRTCYCTTITLPLRLSSGDVERKFSRIAPTFLAQPCPHQPLWDLAGFGITDISSFKSVTQLGVRMKVAAEILELATGPWRWWTRRKAEPDGTRMTLCSFCGETPGLQYNVIARSRRRALSIWSSGGGECRQFQCNRCFCALLHRCLFIFASE